MYELLRSSSTVTVCRREYIISFVAVYYVILCHVLVLLVLFTLKIRRVRVPNLPLDLLLFGWGYIDPIESPLEKKKQ